MKYRWYNLICLIFVAVLSFNAISVLAQHQVLRYADPLIGTGKSNVYTRWGNEGGTYPGAVVPWGYIQLSPETRGTGYEYKDSAILFFSCFYHRSGFPGGSAGKLYLMPVPANADKPKPQSFLHQNEVATGGYYKALLQEDKTIVEATATQRCGVFRITYGTQREKALWINDTSVSMQPGSKNIHCSQRHAVFQFNQSIRSLTQKADGVLLVFDTSNDSVLLVKLSTSSVDHAHANNNMTAELGEKSFDEIKKDAEAVWEKQLAVVSIEDTSRQNKTSFYTALYHSFLMPWVVSDADGSYKGGDGKIHLLENEVRFGGFSPWDTYRTLHPLMTLLYPAKQELMLRSMLRIFNEAGHLPIETMTGNHSVPILVDSYLKGIRPADSLLLYTAMKKSIVDGPFLYKDFVLYKNGFIPHPHTESVTRTVEYTYDDWALAQYAKEIIHDKSMYKMLIERSRSYRKLFDEKELSLLPRKGDKLYRGTANAGYKEGDQWVYTLALPQYQRDLINHLGGDDNFVQHMDAAYYDKRLVFDNETMFHVPYLFNSTSHSYKTAEWVDKIRKRFAATPGGLPGNDDLGSTSSWYVWSAMGLYPVCPGNPIYAIGSPLFKKMIIHLADNKELIIRVNNLSVKKIYVQSVLWNGKNVSPKWIFHDTIMQGGELVFEMGDQPVVDGKVEPLPGDEEGVFDYEVTNFSTSAKQVQPGELFWVKYQLKNKSSDGTAMVKVVADDSLVFEKHRMLLANETVMDSVECRLYAYRKHFLKLPGKDSLSIEVTRLNKAARPVIYDLQSTPVVQQNGKIYCQYTIKNIDGIKVRYVVPFSINGIVKYNDSVTLEPGDTIVVYHIIAGNKAGSLLFKAGAQTCFTKVYAEAKGALVFHIPGTANDKTLVSDVSGFHNNGVQSEFGSFIELPHSASLDSNGKELTMMTWIKDEGNKRPLTEIIAKGDSHVLQLVKGKYLTFFAGGWGRGDVTVDLPNNWMHQWHHIAGVCNGRQLRVFIDGKLAGVTELEEMIGLNVAARWTIGSNEEFPLDRTFKGDLKDTRIYAAALPDEDVLSIFRTATIDPK